MHVVIAVLHEGVNDRTEDAWFENAVCVGADGIQCCSYLRIPFVMPLRAVPATAVRDLLRVEPEQKKVLLTSLSRHLNRRAIASTQGEGAIHHELHIARPTRLEARR